MDENPGLVVWPPPLTWQKGFSQHAVFICVSTQQDGREEIHTANGVLVFPRIWSCGQKLKRSETELGI